MRLEVAAGRRWSAPEAGGIVVLNRTPTMSPRPGDCGLLVKTQNLPAPALIAAAAEYLRCVEAFASSSRAAIREARAEVEALRLEVEKLRSEADYAQLESGKFPAHRLPPRFRIEKVILTLIVATRQHQNEHHGAFSQRDAAGSTRTVACGDTLGLQSRQRSIIEPPLGDLPEFDRRERSERRNERKGEKGRGRE